MLVKIENESKFFLQSFVLAVLCFFLNDFVFFEKVRGKDSRFQDIMNFLINLEKTDQNYSKKLQQYI